MLIALTGLLISVSALPAGAQAPPPDHVHLVVGSDSDCHVGAKRAENMRPGEAVDLKVCAYGFEEQPTTTSGGYFLSWWVQGPATLSSQPFETDDTGTALTTASLTADSPDATVTVAVCSASPCEGPAVIDTSSVVLSVIHGDPICAFNGTGCDGAVLSKIGTRKYLAAVGQWPEECMDSRPLLVKKRKEGADPVVSFLQSDATGEAYFQVPDRWHGRYYVVAPRWKTERDDSLIVCARKRSAAIFIR